MASSLFSLRRDFILPHTALLLSSYRHWTGEELISAGGSPEETALRLFEAPFPVLSGGTEEDQILNFGNLATLDLWEMSWEELTSTPSRLTAEPMHRDERAAFLKRVREHGYVADYAGVRISKTGRRFRIERATVWNLIDTEGNYRGQAATFKEYTRL